MKKSSSSIYSLLAGAGLLLAIAIAPAADRPAAPGDINKLNATISEINTQAHMPQAETTIAKQLARDFNVSQDKVNLVLGNMMQYGDVAAVFAFAEKLPGGITDQNLDKVMQSRYRGAWNNVARGLGIDPVRIAGRLSTVQEGIKTALAESSAGGAAAGGVHQPGK